MMAHSIHDDTGRADRGTASSSGPAMGIGRGLIFFGSMTRARLSSTGTYSNASQTRQPIRTRCS